MDYHSIHGQDISNFSSDLPHRLPAVSAAQALEELNSSSKRWISTGLLSLDYVLQGKDIPLPEDSTPEDGSTFGGVSRGKVTEVFGPPGVGKTAFGMQLTASALLAGERVIWVDGAHPISMPRFSDVITSFKPSAPAISTSVPPDLSGKGSLSDLQDNLTHITTPTLAHLVALLCHPVPGLFPTGTSLIMIDSLSTLVDTAFPKNADSSNMAKKPGAPNPSARKFPVLQYLITSLHKLAATYNIAIVILSQCVTKMRPGAGPALVPAINTTAWEQGLACRVALFRDWGWEVDGNEGNRKVIHARFAEVLKAEGVSMPPNSRRVVAFEIITEGLRPVSLPEIQQDNRQLSYNPISSTPLLPRKRKLSATGLEIPDSEGEDDEDYGWAEDDEEAVPEMPPQWQGSEDILVPPPGELEADSENEEDDTEEKEGEQEPEENISRKIGFKDEIDDSEDELAL
ncbi:P-loop containing nucleoside triphosphate hydrolase protein [Xylogone sp. PMI_703]|nr:P-loop containing nucleoside triphosphate hydrolase protein [Xylogone sp. PMI_703]